MLEANKDYSKSGLDIQYAMLDRAKNDNSTEGLSIRWGRHEVKVADCIESSKTGIIRGEFLSVKNGPDQGFDLKVDGYFELEDGQRVSTLRTWYSSTLPRVVEYPFYSKDNRVWVWNVYKRTYGEGLSVDEKWAGNAGFWIEKPRESERIYHCSHGMRVNPDFDSLVFKVAILPAVHR